MKRFSPAVCALVVVLSAAPFLYVFVRSFLIAWRRYVPVLLRRFSGFPKTSFPLLEKHRHGRVHRRGALLSPIFAGFGFAKYKFPGRNFLFFLLMILMTLPVQVTLVPISSCWAT